MLAGVAVMVRLYPLDWHVPMIQPDHSVTASLFAAYTGKTPLFISRCGCTVPSLLAGYAAGVLRRSATRFDLLYQGIPIIHGIPPEEGFMFFQLHSGAGRPVVLVAR